MNSYGNIARYYDTLMTNGYYDYDALSSDLAQVISHGDRVLELGVGTGLMAEHLLRFRPGIDLTGIDNSEPMLEQAAARLRGEANLYLADVGTFHSDDKFDVVFSCGGVWYLIDSQEERKRELQLCSHIPDVEASRSALGNVVRMLKPEGSLILSIQGVHRDYEVRLDEDLLYRQRIRWSDDVFHKEYVFENGEETSVQHCTYRILHYPEMVDLFENIGMRMTNAPTRYFRLFEST